MILVYAPKDWPEDAGHENGSYYCECVKCKTVFLGHKRRVYCHLCADAMIAEDEAQGKENA